MLSNSERMVVAEAYRTVKREAVAAVRPPSITRADGGKKLDLLMRYGSRPINYSTLQGGLHYFFAYRDKPDRSHLDRNGHGLPLGYVAYKTAGSIWKDILVLGDPICAPQDKALVLDRFLEGHPDSTFWQVSAHTAAALRKRDFYINHCGVETFLDIESYSLIGPQKQNLRTACHKAVDRGIVLREQRLDEVEGRSLQKVSDEWLAGKTVSSGELTFLAREPRFDIVEPYVRTFFAYAGCDIVGFVFFNPLFTNNRVIGYTADIQRTSLDSSKGLGYFMVLKCLEKFRREGNIKLLSLGWSPLYKIEDNENDNSAFTTLYFAAQFQLANNLYNYKGIAKNKSEYRGREEHVYFATRHRYPMRQIYRSYGACNISPLRQLWKAMAS